MFALPPWFPQLDHPILLRVAGTIGGDLVPPVNLPVVQTHLVPIFHSYPRFGTSSQLQLTSAYFAGTFTVAIPWLVLALACSIVALLANVFCAPLRTRKRSARSQLAALERAAAAAAPEKGLAPAAATTTPQQTPIPSTTGHAPPHHLSDSLAAPPPSAPVPALPPSPLPPPPPTPPPPPRTATPSKSHGASAPTGLIIAAPAASIFRAQEEKQDTDPRYSSPLALAPRRDANSLTSSSVDSLASSQHLIPSPVVYHTMEKEQQLGPTASSSSTSSRSSLSARSQLLFGVIFFNLSFLLVGLATIADYAFRDAFRDVKGNVEYLKTKATAPVALAAFFINLIQRVMSVSSAIVGTLLANSPVIASLVSFQSQLHTFITSSQDILNLTSNILRVANIVSLVVFFVIIAFYLFLLFGLFLIFFVQSGGRRSVGCARYLLLLPVALSWVGVGLLTFAGAVAGDACVMLDQFQRIIIVEAGLSDDSLIRGLDPNQNVLYSKGLRCPASLISSSVLTDLAPLFNSSSSVAQVAVDSAISLLFPGASAKGIAAYAESVFADVMSCDSVSHFAAGINNSACTSRGPLLAIYCMWVAAIVLSVVLTVLFFAAQYSEFDTTRFYNPRHISDYGMRITANVDDDDQSANWKLPQ